VHPYTNVEAHLLKICLRYIHIRLRHAGAQIVLPSPRQRLADAEHILSGVVIPGLLQRNAPSAIHCHWVIESAGDGHVRLRHGDSPGSNRNLRILG